VNSKTATARFDELFHANYRRVFEYARRRTSASLADDVVAETFLTAWRRLDAVPRDELPWLLGVARRVLANQRRSDAAQKRVADRLAGEAPANVALPEAPHLEVGLALSRLSELDRELLTLVAWDGLTPSEAGRVLGFSAVNARVRLHRARKRLEGLLQPSKGGRIRWRAADPTF